MDLYISPKWCALFIVFKYTLSNNIYN
ncbi:unnamed protein product [Spirodela intermedia]|uniref:Uncharacterized protein n=1 Tax=Spirodela intermedia TaxID=51605 RepID=A0A7I8L681_SPIIN|nr:unnamed protein product [Spirodela intermedia]